MTQYRLNGSLLNFPERKISSWTKKAWETTAWKRGGVRRKKTGGAGRKAVKGSFSSLWLSHAILSALHDLPPLACLIMLLSSMKSNLNFTSLKPSLTPPGSYLPSLFSKHFVHDFIISTLYESCQFTGLCPFLDCELLSSRDTAWVIIEPLRLHRLDVGRGCW